MISLGKQLKIARATKNILLEQAAAAIPMKEDILRAFEEDSAKPNAEQCIALATFYELEEPIVLIDAALTTEPDFWENITNKTPIGISFGTLDGDIFYVNEYWCELVGMSKEEAKGKGWLKVMHPEDLELVLEGLAEKFPKLSEGEHIVDKVRYINQKTGDIIHALIHITALRNTKGELLGFVGSAQDITEEKEALAENSRYREIFDILTEEVYVCKVNRGADGVIEGWTIEEANSTALNSWNLKKEDVLGKNPMDILGSDIINKYMPHVQEVFATGEPYYSETYMEWTGQYLAATTIPFGDYFLATARDITKFKAIEKELREANDTLEQRVEERTSQLAVSLSREREINKIKSQFIAENNRYREVFDILAEEVYICKVNRSADGKIEGWTIEGANLAALKSWNKTEEEVLGKNPNDLFGYDLIGNYIDVIQEVFDTGKPYYVEEDYMEGTGQYLESITISFGDYFFSTARDITKYKAIEKELREVNENLEHLATELAESLDREQKINAIKSRFITAGSHEFRTPLTVIRSSLALIEKYRVLGNVDKEQDHLDKIKSATNLLEGIVSTFLSFDKLDKGLVNIVPEKIDLSVFFEEIFASYESSLSEAQHLLLEYEGGRSVYLDKRIFGLVCSNLITNAIKYSQKDVRVRVDVTTERLKLQVIDQGIGIPKHNQNQVFETFFRAENVGTIQGTGLGLNIVKQYLDLLEGEISFYSEENRGTSFTVIIPSILVNDEELNANEREILS